MHKEYVGPQHSSIKSVNTNQGQPCASGTSTYHMA